MSKTIEKIETYKAKEIEKAISKLKPAYEEAKDFYTDTGYDRYYNKMQKIESELQELEEYIHKSESSVKDLTTEEYREYLDMKMDLKNLASKFFYMFADFNLPESAEIKGIQQILEKYIY